MKKTLQFRRERPFVMVDYAVVMSGQLSVYELAVYLVLCAYADSREGTCFPSYQTIARKAGCSRRKAIDAVARLESLGLIRKEVRKTPAATIPPTSIRLWRRRPLLHHRPMQMVHRLMHSVPQPMRRIHPNQIQKTRFKNHRIIFLSIPSRSGRSGLNIPILKKKCPTASLWWRCCWAFFHAWNRNRTVRR